MTTVYSLGHSTLPIDSFIELLKSYQINLLVDVRTIPRSRHNPQFNKESLPASLKSAKIRYLHLQELGGLRKPARDSINDAWENLSFRGYADYMQTDEFKQGIDELVKLSKKNTVAIMCAEAVPWRCHRSLIEDALLVRKITPVDIYNPKASKPHKLTPWAIVRRDKKITYPKTALSKKKKEERESE